MMRKQALFPVVVAGILIILAVLYISFGHLRHEREEALNGLAGSEDELSEFLRVEADEFRITNRNQQRGILAVMVVVVLELQGAGQSPSSGTNWASPTSSTQTRLRAG